MDSHVKVVLFLLSIIVGLLILKLLYTRCCSPSTSEEDSVEVLRSDVLGDNVNVISLHEEHSVGLDLESGSINISNRVDSGEHGQIVKPVPKRPKYSTHQKKKSTNHVQGKEWWKIQYMEEQGMKPKASLLNDRACSNSYPGSSSGRTTSGRITRAPSGTWYTDQYLEEKGLKGHYHKNQSSAFSPSPSTVAMATVRAPADAWWAKEYREKKWNCIILPPFI